MLESLGFAVPGVLGKMKKERGTPNPLTTLEMDPERGVGLLGLRV